jgi:hypothetical protein
LTQPEQPNNKIVNSYLSQWTTLENYALQEKSLNLLFNNLCSDNKSIEDILLKVSILNDFYSTNIFDTYTVAKHIFDCNIDQELLVGNIDLVNKIALVKIKDKTRNFYFFASKYCAHHQPTQYAIYDSYVEKMLWHFKKLDKFYDFKRDDLSNYQVFMDAIKYFSEFYNLQKFTLKEIDIYLWLAGKKYFPNKY